MLGYEPKKGRLIRVFWGRQSGISASLSRRGYGREAQFPVTSFQLPVTSRKVQRTRDHALKWGHVAMFIIFHELLNYKYLRFLFLVFSSRSSSSLWMEKRGQTQNLKKRTGFESGRVAEWSRKARRATCFRFSVSG